MTAKQALQLQEDIITYCDDLPQELTDALCQAVVDYFNSQDED